MRSHSINWRVLPLLSYFTAPARQRTIAIPVVLAHRNSKRLRAKEYIFFKQAE